MGATLSYPILSYPVLSCPILSYPILSVLSGVHAARRRLIHDNYETLIVLAAIFNTRRGLLNTVLIVGINTSLAQNVRYSSMATVGTNSSLYFRQDL